MTEDDFELSDIYDDMRERSKQKRQEFRDRAPKLLEEAGISFSSHNGGAHLIVLGQHESFDFWPGTGRWMPRGGSGDTYKRTKFGIFNLIKRVKGE